MLLWNRSVASIYILQTFAFYFSGVFLAFATVLPLIEADDQTYMTDQETSFQLNCTIKDFHFDSVTPRWSKKQLEDEEELLLFVGIRPQIPQKGDFARYKTSYVDQTNGFVYQLHINHTQPQDSGQYICDILDINGNTVYRMNNTLNVIVPVKSVVLFRNYSDSNMTFVSSELPFHYFVTIVGSVGCQVTGGNPLPNVTVSIGSTVSIPQSLVQVSTTWAGPKSGFKKPSWLVISYTEQFRVLPEYDGGNIVCTASIYNYSVSSSKIILVNAVPYFYTNACQSEQQAPLGTKKAHLSCRFHAHPAGLVNWTKADVSVTQAHSSISNSDVLQMIHLDGQNDFIAKLIFSKVTEDRFQMYKITISNDFGSNSTIIRFSKSGQTFHHNCCKNLFVIAFLIQAATVISF